MLRLTTLGSLELRDEAGAALLARRRKPLVLLAYLAWADGWLPREEVATLLWGERDEARARNSLRQALFQLRGVLEEGLELERERIRLQRGTVELDAGRFEEEARTEPEQAVRRWGGEFLPGADELGTEAFRGWLDARRASLRIRYLEALQSLTAEAADRGSWAEALDRATAWADEAPLDEAAQTEVVRALRALGRDEEAAGRHAAFVEHYRAALGESPSQEFFAVLDSTPAPARPSPGSAALFSPDLVGRDDALGSLRSAWESVRQGGTGIVLVRGEAGIGKTRLCAEFVRWLDRESDDRALVLKAQAVNAVRGDGLTMARDLLAPLRDAPGLSGASTEALAELTRVLPSVRGRYPDLPPASGTLPALRDAVGRVIADVAAEVPVVIFVDDLPSAEADSQELVLSLLRRMPPWTLLLVTARTDEVSAVPELAEPEHMWDLGVLELGPLGVDDMDALVASMLHMPDPDRKTLAERLCAETGGNPFYAIELVRALVDEGRVASDERGVFRPQDDTDARLPLPTSVQESVVRRIERLSPEVRTVLNGAAVLERFRRSSLLARMVREPPLEVSRALDALIALRMLHISSDGCYEFAHPLVQRAAYEHVPPHDRQRLHRRAARLMESRRYRSPESDAVRAYHLRTGGQRGMGLRTRRLVWTTTLVAGALVTAVGGTRLASLTGTETPIVSVAEVRDLAGPVPLAESMPQLLTTALARIDGLHVISTDRLYELSSGVTADSSTRLITAARRAGAQQVLVGELSRIGDEWHLTLRRIDLATGVVERAYVVEAPEPTELVRDVAARVARDLGLQPPEGGTEEGVSLAADKLYKQGLRAYYRGDHQAADQLFEAALTADSTFAMAAYYASRSLNTTDVPRAHELLAQARRMADHAPPAQRLLIRGTWADVYDEPSGLAIAETLAVRYPEDPDGQLLYGHALTGEGEFLEAVPHLRRVVEMDSASLRIPGGRCRACEAYEELTEAYRSADSMVAAERVAREWVVQDSGSARPWAILSDVLEDEGSLDEALVARRRSQSLQTIADPYDITYPAQIALKAGSYTEAEERLGELSQSGDPALASQARWLQIINLRYQGRLREALDVARRFRANADSALPLAGPVPFEALPTAQIMWEMGRTRAAAALFDSLAASLATPPGTGRGARMRAWYLTHVADALASGGDTTRLVVLADSIERLGKRSAYGRDRLLFHHVRGLLLAARGEDAAAASELEAAIVSESQGYTRTNYELAKVLLRLDKPEAAVAQLLPVFEAPIDASNYYLSRTDVYALLGEAEQRAGQRAAAIHYDQKAAQAWRLADPSFRARRDSVLARLRSLE